MSENTFSGVKQAEATKRLRFSQVLTVPNQLTLLRMVVLPFVLISMIYGHHTLSLWLFAAAAVTDGIDGIVARRFNQKTELGQYLDPIADKLLLSSCFVAQSVIGTIPWWVTILVLLRDVVIVATVLVVLLATSMRGFPPSMFGKANTVIQIATLTTVLVNNVVLMDRATEVIAVLVWMTAITTVLSAVHYALVISSRLYPHQGPGDI